MRNHVLLRSVGLGALLLAVGSSVSAEKIDRRFHRVFDVQEGAKLVLHHGDGEVSITPWEKSAIDVEVVYRASMKRAGSGKTIDFDVEFDQSGDTVRVVGREPSMTVVRGLSYHWEREYSYAVKAPPWMALELEREDGEVSIRAWSGAISLDLSDGDLEIDGLQGEFWIRARMGIFRSAIAELPQAVSERVMAT